MWDGKCKGSVGNRPCFVGINALNESAAIMRKLRRMYCPAHYSKPFACETFDEHTAIEPRMHAKFEAAQYYDSVIAASLSAK